MQIEKNTNNTFSNIINFTNKFIKSENHINTEKFNQAIKTTNFDELKKKEETEGFEEAVYSKKEGKIKAFFNLGSNNNYKSLLSPETSKKIERLFNKEMRELGYL